MMNERKFLYSPILKAKLGEYQGLFSLDASIKDAVLPLLVLPPFSEYDNEQRKILSPGEHVKRFGSRLWEHWGRRPILIDGEMIDEDYTSSGIQDHAMLALFQRARNSGAFAIPVTSLDRTVAYQEAICRIVSFDGAGAALRLKLVDLESPDLTQRVDQLLSLLKCEPARVYLYVDLGYRSFGDQLEGLADALSGQLSVLPHLNHWRIFFLSATEFPPNLSDVKANQQKEFRRGEWSLYRLLADRVDFRFPLFSDYGVEHPIFPAPGPHRVSIHLRYTTDKGCYVVKGPEGKGYDRIRLACASIVGSGHFLGDNFSAGDRFISQCARNLVDHGGPSTWRGAATNHHITKVVRELALKSQIEFASEPGTPPERQMVLFDS